jgi:hypothetical protein
MTTTLNSIATTIQIRRGANIVLSISYDYTNLDTSMQEPAKLQSLIDQATVQWWDSLTSFQKSVHHARGLNLRISARCQK